MLGQSHHVIYTLQRYDKNLKLPDAYALGGLAVEGALLDVEGFILAVHVGHHAVHTLLVHRVGVGTIRIVLSESIIVDEGSVVL